MNEFNAQTGGRYVYVDDVLNLQDLALAFGRVFDECDNFIISGCEVSGSSIGSGYVYLNSKIRHFSGASGITTWPQYLYENNSTESVHYASGNTKIGRNIYGVSVGSSVPNTTDALTNNIPVSMVITQSGGTQMKDAFFGKYALVLNPANLSQVLNGTLKIDGDLEVTGNVRSLKNRYRIVEAQAAFDAFFNNNLILQTQYDTSKNTYALSMEDGVGFKASINSVAVAQITNDGMTLPGHIQASLGILGNVGIANTGICNRTEATDTATLNINMVGYNGENGYFRNTLIGNGKGTAILSIDGKSQTAQITGSMIVASDAVADSIIVKTDKKKTDASVLKTIAWKDANQETMCYLGYSDNTDCVLRLANNLAGISIYGASNSYVDLAPSIRENGQALVDKYLQISNFNSQIAAYAKSESVYNKTESDARYSKVTDGFSGYVSAGKTQAELRKQIDAASTSDLSNYLSKSAYLSDIATSETLKKKIRDNIGAISKDEAQVKQKDTGWTMIASPSLYVRQIGNVICIQGIVYTQHSGTLFTLPNNVDPPPYGVISSGAGATYAPWIVEIKPNTRQGYVSYCSNACGRQSNFLITYMV